MHEAPVFSVVMIFPVLNANVEQFVALNKAAAAIYRELGADATEIVRLYDSVSKYGCASVDKAVEISSGETLFVITDRFRDHSAFETVNKLADEHAQLNALFMELSTILQMSRVVRFECEKIL